ncbi:MAG: NUDIX hydrolase [Gemmatimonadetes bacterium]|nr:NUDIX hydrolase [Gemmatimonadota bacterium]MCA9763705.1 NUDIX hydrolase [Gemmatimonadota bacterium]MCB9517677.1 NUDIX hydrolase [Gemmatimonadales bacterium]HPF62995.1 NUDIX hydrolase [Gemmatimonadales bacterium]HRX19815.1 NUDIX hydrolase [Gemmatimonadales bacterium]
MTLLSTRRVHTGRVVSLDIDTVEFPNGQVGELEMLRHPGASAVVPFLDDPADADPRIVLIRQFRHATDGWLWEIPAGRREGSEAPEVTARRELQEETGYGCGRLERITSTWTTPGFTDEVIHLYWAADLVPGATAHERDEVLDLHPTRWSVVMTMIADGTIRDAKTLIAILALAAQRR